jgi:hypothetical protein
MDASFASLIFNVGFGITTAYPVLSSSFETSVYVFERHNNHTLFLIQWKQISWPPFHLQTKIEEKPWEIWSERINQCLQRSTFLAILFAKHVLPNTGNWPAQVAKTAPFNAAWRAHSSTNLLLSSPTWDWIHIVSTLSLFHNRLLHICLHSSTSAVVKNQNNPQDSDLYSDSSRSQVSA